VVVGSVPVGPQAILREEVKVLRANKDVTSIKFWAIKKGPDGKAVNADGQPLADGEDFVLEPVTAKEVLAKPPKPGTK
jgi:hypothetical protein